MPKSTSKQSKKQKEAIPNYALKSYKYGLITIAVMTFGFIGLRLAQSSQAAPTAVTAVQADKFVDSIGVNTHWHYGGRNYLNQMEKVTDLFIASGIRHYRDYPTRVGEPAANKLCQHGIKMSGIMGFVSNLDGVRNEHYPAIKRLSANNCVQYAEGANEPRGSSINPGARDHMKLVFDLMKSDPVTRNIRLAGPGMTWANELPELGNISQWVDVSNMHPYPGGELPSHQRYLDDKFEAQRLTAPGKPVIMTETGYHNKVPSDTTHRGTPEDVAGVYFPRMFMEYFRNGIERTYTYEFADQHNNGLGDVAEGRFGIIRHDLSLKPAYTAVKNMITLLSDKGPNFTPSSLSYELTGSNNQTKTVLMQKRDGTFWLAVYQENSMWNPSTRIKSDPPNVPVSLKLAAPASAIRTYMPNRGVSPIIQQNNTSNVSFESQEEMTLVQIGSADASNPTPDPTPDPNPQPGQPDLIVTAISHVPANPTTGQATTFSATIKNQGTAATPTGTILGVAFKINGVMSNWSDTHTASLATGASVTLSANSGPTGVSTWDALSGTHTIQAVVDDIDRIKNESNETNNTLSKSMSVAGTSTAGNGDANNDGRVNAIDLSIVISRDGQNFPAADFNNDGTVGAADMAILLSKWTW